MNSTSYLQLNILIEFIFVHFSRPRTQHDEVFQVFEDIEEDLEMRFLYLVIVGMFGNHAGVLYEIEVVVVRVCRHLNGKTLHMLNAFNP
jgi:hypothetical protein